MAIFKVDEGNTLVPLPLSVVTEVFDKGFAYFTLPSGTKVAITKEELVFDMDEVNEVLAEQKMKTVKKRG